MRRKFPALCHFFFQDMEQHYDNNLLEWLNLLTLQNMRRHLDAFLLINIFSGTKRCPSALETFGLRVPTRNFGNFTLFTCSATLRPSARCVSTANVVGKVKDIFTNYCRGVKSINWSIFLCFCCFFFVLPCAVILLLFVFVLTLSMTTGCGVQRVNE
jgi:hypothetical protein